MAPTKATEPPTKRPKPLPSRSITKKNKKTQKPASSHVKNPALEAALAIAQQNRTNSPLLRLPGEIRNQIYEYALGGHYIEHYQTYSTTSFGTRSGPAGCGWASRSTRHWRRLQSLSLTCRDLRAETQVLPYTLNVIRFRGTLAFYLWSKKASRDVRMSIKSIRFDDTDLVLCGMRMPSYRRGLSHIRTLPNLEKVIISSRDGDEALGRAFAECLKRQGGQWQLVVVDWYDQEHALWNFRT